MYSDTGAAFDRFCPTVTQPWKKTRRLQRAMDRSRRATNPECFNPNRTWKKGAKATVRSRRYQALALKRRERDRRLASERKRSHGQLANAVLGRGSEVRLEKLSYKAWQKTFGRSVTVRGPGGFVAILKRKLQALDGNLVEINPYETALSQFDHTTGEYVKKPLKRRVHYFGDGTTAPVHRDLYSAFLARHCGCENLDVPGVIDAWPRAEQLVRRAMLLLDAKGRPIRQMDLPRFRGEVRYWVSVTDVGLRRPPCRCSSLVRPQRSPFLHPGPCAGSAVAHSPCQARADCAPARACA